MLSVVYESWPFPATSSGSRCVTVPRQWPESGCSVSVSFFVCKGIHFTTVYCYPQEPGSNQEIKEFAAGYNVKFDMYSKICVNGDDAHPLWKWMKVQPKGRGMLGK